MEAQWIQFVERNNLYRLPDGGLWLKRERVVTCLFTLFLRARERGRHHGNFAEGYRQPTTSPYQKVRRDRNLAPVESSRSGFFELEMRSSARTMPARSLPGNGLVVDPAKYRLRPGPHVTSGRSGLERSQHNDPQNSE